MAEWIIEEKDTPEQYSDGASVEHRILQYVQDSPTGDYESVLMKDNSWPVYYHLSPIREDILSWYDFPSDADVLEIGAGMGAVTGALCRAAGTVTAVELTVPRAKILYERHKNFDNLTIRVGNFNRMTFDKKFDFITLIGVFEYARIYTEDGNPKTFLSRIRNLLKPDGKLLIAIENRYGLKYWCGANEDHLMKPFIGIRGYKDPRGVVTYSRQDLIQILDACGFSRSQFFYPLPDYKFPLVIYSDRRLPNSRISDKVKDYYIGKPALLFSERDALSQVISNGAFPFMANSFLVECGGEEATLTNLTFASFTPERLPKKRIITRIRDNTTVEKIAALPEGKQHLPEIMRAQSHFSSSKVVPYVQKKDLLEMPVIDGTPLDLVLVRLLEEGDIETAFDWIFRFRSCLEEMCAVPAGIKDGVPLGAIDLIFQNCMVKDNNFLFFDQEWLKPGASVDFILYRSIHTMYLNNAHLEALLPRRQLMDRVGISKEQEKAFHQQEVLNSKNIICQKFNCVEYLGRQKGISLNASNAATRQVIRLIRDDAVEAVKKPLRPIWHSLKNKLHK